MLNFLNIHAESKSSFIKKTILNYFVANGNATIQELAKVVSLSVPTVTKMVGELLNAGYVNEYGKQETGEGRRPVLYGLNPDSGYFVGVEIKDDMVNMALMNFRGDIVDMEDNCLCRIDNTMESVEALCKVVRAFIEKTGVDGDKVHNVLFCISGRVSADSGYSHTLYNFTEQPLTVLLTEKLGFTATIENDTRAYAYGEYMKGEVHSERNVLFFNVSLGLGLGIIINGELYAGKSGFSGEIGHMHMFDNEILCHCGKKGCLETEASGRALLRIVSERIKAGETTFLKTKANGNCTLDEIIEAVNNEDPLCIEAIELVGKTVGEAVANMINVFNPELVIIGGLLARAGDFLLQAIKVSVRKYSLNLVNRDTRICLSKLNERGGVIGACLLARKKVLE